MSEAIAIGIVNPISIPLFLSLFVNLILPLYLKSFWPCGIIYNTYIQCISIKCVRRKIYIIIALTVI